MSTGECGLLPGATWGLPVRVGGVCAWGAGLERGCRCRVLHRAPSHSTFKFDAEEPPSSILASPSARESEGAIPPRAGQLPPVRCTDPKPVFKTPQRQQTSLRYILACRRRSRRCPSRRRRSDKGALAGWLYTHLSHNAITGP